MSKEEQNFNYQLQQLHQLSFHLIYRLKSFNLEYPLKSFNLVYLLKSFNLEYPLKRLLVFVFSARFILNSLFSQLYRQYLHSQYQEHRISDHLHYERTQHMHYRSKDIANSRHSNMLVYLSDQHKNVRTNHLSIHIHILVRSSMSISQPDWNIENSQM